MAATTATSQLNIRRGASRSLDPDLAARELHAAIAQDGATFGVFYCAPGYDLERLAAALRREFGSLPLIGCTTAGEITPLGYIDGALTGATIQSPRMHAAIGRLDNLAEFEFQQGHELVATLLKQLGRHQQPGGSNTFGFLLIDGLCMREEAVVARCTSSSARSSCSVAPPATASASVIRTSTTRGVSTRTLRCSRSCSRALRSRSSSPSTSCRRTRRWS